MDMLNPYVELKRIQQQNSLSGGMNNLPQLGGMGMGGMGMMQSNPGQPGPMMGGQGQLGSMMSSFGQTPGMGGGMGAGMQPLQASAGFSLLGQMPAP